MCGVAIEYVFSQHTGFGESVCCVFVFMMGKVQFGSRYLRDVEDAVPYCGAGHIIDSRFSRQYRIILSADTASEVRQLLSQKRR